MVGLKKHLTGMDMMISYSLKQLDKFKEDTIRKNAIGVMGNTSGAIIEMFETVIEHHCPGAKYHWVMPSKENIRPRDPYFAPGVSNPKQSKIYCRASFQPFAY